MDEDDQRIILPFLFGDDDGLRQLLVDVVSAVLNGNGQIPPAPGDHGDGLTAVAAQGEQKAVEFLVVCFDPLNDIFLTLLCIYQSHIYHPLLVAANSTAM